MLVRTKKKSLWMRLGYLTGALGVLFTSVACQVNSPKKVSQPDWVLNTPIQAGFIYGVGSAEIFGNNKESALTRAKDVARLELIKQIKVDISGAVEQEIKEVTRGSETVLTRNLRSAVTSQVPTFTLRHVEQVDSYQWPDGQRVSVMVRFNVARELASLAEQVAAIDLELKEYEAKLGVHTSSSMSVLRALAPALVIVDQRAGLQARINELDPSRRSQPLLTPEIRDLVSRIYALVSKLKISVTAESGKDDSFRTNLIAQLTKRGLSISDTQKADAQIVYALRVNELQRDGAFFAITEGDVLVKDELGRVVRALQAKAKGGSSDVVEARSRSIKKLADTLGNALLEALLK